MDTLTFNLKFTAKQFAKSSKKAEKEEAMEKEKCKKMMEKGNLDGARIHAQNAIRKKSEALNYLRLQSRIDAVASRVDTAMKMRTVSKSMAGVVKGMDKVMQSMDVNKIVQVMDQFEKQFENLDITSEVLENAIGSTTALSTPEDQVNMLMGQISDQHNLNVAIDVNGIRTGAPLPQRQVEQKEADDLEARLAALRTRQ
jgi:charged multivesicular body protein 1